MNDSPLRDSDRELAGPGSETLDEYRRRLGGFAPVRPLDECSCGLEDVGDPENGPKLAVVFDPNCPVHRGSDDEPVGPPCEVCEDETTPEPCPRCEVAYSFDDEPPTAASIAAWRDRNLEKCPACAGERPGSCPNCGTEAI